MSKHIFRLLIGLAIILFGMGLIYMLYVATLVFGLYVLAIIPIVIIAYCAGYSIEAIIEQFDD